MKQIIKETLVVLTGMVILITGVCAVFGGLLYLLESTNCSSYAEAKNKKYEYGLLKSCYILEGDIKYTKREYQYKTIGVKALETEQ